MIHDPYADLEKNYDPTKPVLDIPSGWFIAIRINLMAGAARSASLSLHQGYLLDDSARNFPFSSHLSASDGDDEFLSVRGSFRTLRFPRCSRPVCVVSIRSLSPLAAYIQLGAESFNSLITYSTFWQLTDLFGDLMKSFARLYE